eukprot:comp22549_c0_seq1/m.57653 comp22549_c0_seq1/g.57653  ORF comp22549_c0_seq1/g.57653 comp22549_c0_seq1/m.57653 type:complete len:321 (+) comp22549_c0_seq1:2076-3038(+)
MRAVCELGRIAQIHFHPRRRRQIRACQRDLSARVGRQRRRRRHLRHTCRNVVELERRQIQRVVETSNSNVELPLVAHAVRQHTGQRRVCHRVQRRACHWRAAKHPRADRDHCAVRCGQAKVVAIHRHRVDALGHRVRRDCADRWVQIREQGVWGRVRCDAVDCDKHLQVLALARGRLHHNLVDTDARWVRERNAANAARDCRRAAISAEVVARDCQLIGKQPLGAHAVCRDDLGLAKDCDCRNLGRGDRVHRVDWRAACRRQRHCEDLVVFEVCRRSAFVGDWDHNRHGAVCRRDRCGCGCIVRPWGRARVCDEVVGAHR